MSKKTLLNESTVRKFMKFANIEGLAQNFINETYKMEEEELEEGMHAEEEMEEAMHDEGMGKYMEGAHEEGMYAEGAHEEGMHDEGMHGEDMEEGMHDEDMDADVDDDMGGAELEMSQDEAMALAQGLVDALTDLTGHEFTASTAGGDMETELPGDEGPDDMAMDADMDDKEDDMDDKDDDLLDEEALVTETVRRVMDRIKSANKRDQLIETVTDRIIARIKNSK